jgi:hypothetical protein
MKLRLAYTLFIGSLLLIVSLGNKNGRASTPPGHGNTGAPGDESAGGQPIVCNSCHTNSNITSTMTVSILDSAETAVTQYVPGRQYTARATITPVTGNPQRYGFQMIALKDAGNADLDGFSDVNPNNYKVVTVNSTGRTYAEHDNVSVSNVFNVKWTAPVAGTGNITFYAAGNAVNNNGQSTGDGATFTNLKLTEGSATSTHNPDAERIGLQVWPNPVSSSLNISVNLPQASDYRITLHDLSGRMVWENNRSLHAGENLLNIPATDWDAGVYFAVLSGAGISASVKVVKL